MSTDDTFTWSEVMFTSGDEVEPRYLFPRDRTAGQDGLMLRVAPLNAPAWIGTFCWGPWGGIAQQVERLPNSDRLFVVSRGSGYVVSASTPDDWFEVGLQGIAGVHRVDADGVFICHDAFGLLALGADGERWRTPRIALDGLTVTAIRQGVVYAEVSMPGADEPSPVELDVRTGALLAGEPFLW